MAIKVGGTTVIDDSRNLVNIASGAGSSTTFGDVGTHAFLYFYGYSLTEGDTKAGSDLYPAGLAYGQSGYTISNNSLRSLETTRGATAVSGTWRAMGRVYPSSLQYDQTTRVTLYVRIA